MEAENRVIGAPSQRMLAVTRGRKSQRVDSPQNLWRQPCPARNLSVTDDNWFHTSGLQNGYFKSSSLKVICYGSHRKSIQVLPSIWLWSCSIPVCCPCSSLCDFHDKFHSSRPCVCYRKVGLGLHNTVRNKNSFSIYYMSMFKALKTQ